MGIFHKSDGSDPEKLLLKQSSTCDNAPGNPNCWVSVRLFMYATGDPLTVLYFHPCKSIICYFWGLCQCGIEIPVSSTMQGYRVENTTQTGKWLCPSDCKAQLNPWEAETPLHESGASTSQRVWAVLAASSKLTTIWYAEKAAWKARHWKCIIIW